MDHRLYDVASAVVFTLVCILQVLRALNQWPVQIGDWQIPVWASWLAALLAGLLATWGFRLARGR
jgi:hypothetical protein